MQDDGAYAIANIEAIKLDSIAGTWMSLTGRNLGLENRELNGQYSRQGDWGVFLDYSATPAYSPYIVNTGLQGIGTDNLTVQAAGKRDVILNTERERLTLGGQKHFAGNWGVQVKFTNEEKDGARLYGRGTTGGNGNFNFLAEPISTTTKQLEVLFSYNGERFQAEGGYYGSFFNNHFSQLNITGGGAGLNGAGAGTFSPMALPPDNQAHQLNLSGGYSFTPTTRGTFKIAYTRATQDDGFIGLPAGGTNISGRSDLGGRVDTTLVNLGLTSRPMPKLALLASVRYEDRDDKTPVVQYIDTSATGTHDGTNEVRSFRSTTAKFEAAYQMPQGFKAVAGVDHEIKERTTSPYRAVSHREETEETSYRLELRRSLSETLNGSLAYVHSDRDGSDFLFNVRFNNSNGSNLIAPIHLADRERDRAKLSLDWAPTEALSIQAAYSQTWDDYTTRFDLGLGARDGRAHLASLDVAYAINDDWKVTGWASRSDNRINQRSGPNAAASPATPAAGVPANLFDARQHDRNDAFGLGLRGKVGSKLDLGADFQFSKDVSMYDQVAVTGAAVGSIPNVEYETTTFSLFARYAVQKNAGVQFDLVHDRRVADDWTWQNWVYNTTTANAEATTVRQNPTQKTNFIGVSGYYRWQ
jgi:MtrB/PioB family decaheme-associated outer membrane protein